ncbi:hypothetical protein CRUP_028067, partial [Coryphaenoides rupestris]
MDQSVQSEPRMRLQLAENLLRDTQALIHRLETNLSFLRQQLMRMATHILRCNDHTYGPRLLLLCTQSLFECLALNLYCLNGEQRALTTVINHRIGASVIVTGHLTATSLLSSQH